MTPVLFINCKEYPYIEAIMSGLKKYETRNKDTLRQLAGKRVLIAETGHGKPVVRCSAFIGTKSIRIDSADAWEWFRPAHKVPFGASHDWKPETTEKYLYELIDVQKVAPFTPPEGKRHGRVWMELGGYYNMLDTYSFL